MTSEHPPARPREALEPDPGAAGRTRVDFGRLVADLRSLGVRREQDLLVHCSMRRVGWVDGGPATLPAAIQHVTGVPRRHGRSRPGRVRPVLGMGVSRWAPVRTAVDFAVNWLPGYRNWEEHDK